MAALLFHQKNNNPKALALKEKINVGFLHRYHYEYIFCVVPRSDMEKNGIYTMAWWTFLSLFSAAAKH